MEDAIKLYKLGMDSYKAGNYEEALSYLSAALRSGGISDKFKSKIMKVINSKPINDSLGSSPPSYRATHTTRGGYSPRVVRLGEEMLL